MSIEQLTFTRFRVAFKVVERSPFPADKGPAFRRGLIAALREASCGQEPGLCPVGNPLPFVYTPPMDDRTRVFPGDALNASLILVGRAVDHIACYIDALDRHARRGLGSTRCRVILEQVDWLDPRDRKWTQFYFSKEQQIRSKAVPFSWPHIMERAALLKGRQRISLHFDTRVRLDVSAGHETLLAVDILRPLHCRIMDAAARWCASTNAPRNMENRAAPQEVTVVDDQLEYRTRPRRSSNSAGVVTLSGNLDEWFPLLVAGQHLHLGRNAAMGFGGYELRA